MIYLIQTDWEFSFVPHQEAIAHESQVQYTEFPMYRFLGLVSVSIGLKFKDLLFSVFSKLNEVSNRGRPFKSFPTYLVAQKIPQTVRNKS